MADEIVINGKLFNTLFAISQEEQEIGLMGVRWPPPIMSFPYKSPQINKFWMKNTVSPLDIIFANNGIIIDIQAGEPLSTKLIGGNYFSDLVIEMPLGTCELHGISIGDKISYNLSQASFNKLGVFAQNHNYFFSK